MFPVFDPLEKLDHSIQLATKIKEEMKGLKSWSLGYFPDVHHFFLEPLLVKGLLHFTQKKRCILVYWGKEAGYYHLEEKPLMGKVYRNCYTDFFASLSLSGLECPEWVYELLSSIRILTTISEVAVIQVNEATRDGVFQCLKEIDLEEVCLICCECMTDLSPVEEPLQQYHTLLSCFEEKRKLNLEGYPPLFQMYGALMQHFGKEMISFLYLNAQVLKLSTKPSEGYASIVA